jgi:hypothetical protein
LPQVLSLRQALLMHHLFSGKENNEQEKPSMLLNGMFGQYFCDSLHGLRWSEVAANV